MIRSTLLAMVGGMALVACGVTSTDRDASGPGPEVVVAPAGSILFFNGTVHCGLPTRRGPNWGLHPRHWGDAYRVLQGATIPGRPGDALVCSEGRILALGDLTDLQREMDLSACRRIDLNGATVLPGLQDAHGHVEGFGGTLENVDLVGAEAYPEVIRRIAERASTLPDGTWITGRGWDQTLWPGAEFPKHDALSAAVPNHPVFVRRVDGHAGLANRAALEAGGLYGKSIDTPVFEGGRIVVDERGHATGVLVDLAMPRVGMKVPPVSKVTRKRRVLAAQDALIQVGLTCVHDMSLDDGIIEIYQELLDEGLLKLRIVGYRGAHGLTSNEELAHLPIAPDSLDRLSIPGVKLMVDGALGSRGAALLQPYADAPDEIGLSRYTDEQIRDLVVRMARLGLQPATHAIGDRANRQVIDAFLAAFENVESFRALRPRLEHVQVLALNDIDRIMDLNQTAGSGTIVCSMQPTHGTSDMRWAEERLGPERVKGAYAWRSLTPHGRLAFGSDFPVERPHPLEGLYAAMTRQDANGSPDGGWRPEERLAGDETVHAFTYGAAFAAGQEDRRGLLLPGYACDMTVIDVDPYALGPGNAHELLDAHVLMTVINGEILFPKQ